MGERYDISVSVFDVSEKEARQIMDRVWTQACGSRLLAVLHWFGLGWLRLGRIHHCRREWTGGMNGPHKMCAECGEDDPKHDEECSRTPAVVTGPQRITVTNSATATDLTGNLSDR